MVLLGCSEKEKNEITFQTFKANTHDWKTQHVSLKGSRKQHTDLTVEPNLYWFLFRDATFWVKQPHGKKNHAYNNLNTIFVQIREAQIAELLYPQ